MGVGGHKGVERCDSSTGGQEDIAAGGVFWLVQVELPVGAVHLDQVTDPEPLQRGGQGAAVHQLDQEVHVGAVGVRVHGVLPVDAAPGYADVEALPGDDRHIGPLRADAVGFVGQVLDLQDLEGLHF